MGADDSPRVACDPERRKLGPGAKRIGQERRVVEVRSPIGRRETVSGIDLMVISTVYYADALGLSVHAGRRDAVNATPSIVPGWRCGVRTSRRGEYTIVSRTGEDRGKRNPVPFSRTRGPVPAGEGSSPVGGGRVAAGSYPPAAPSGPGVPDSGNCQACRECTIRERRTKSWYRGIVRYVNETSPAAQGSLRSRGPTVTCPDTASPTVGERRLPAASGRSK